jgi:hypothetical protein
MVWQWLKRFWFYILHLHIKICLQLFIATFIVYLIMLSPTSDSTMKWNPSKNLSNLIGNTKKLYPLFKQKYMNTLLIHWMYNMKETRVLQLILQLNLSCSGLSQFMSCLPHECCWTICSSCTKQSKFIHNILYY